MLHGIWVHCTHVEIHALAERNWVRQISRERNGCKCRGSNRNRAWQASRHMFERAEPEELVLDYSPAGVRDVRIQAALWLGGEGRESRLSVQPGPSQDIRGFSMQTIR